MTQEELIEKHPRIFRQMSAATHDYEICVSFVKCKESHLLQLDEACSDIQSYLDYMNRSRKHIKQVVITNVTCRSNSLLVVYEGGDEYTSKILGDINEQTAGH